MDNREFVQHEDTANDTVFVRVGVYRSESSPCMSEFREDVVEQLAVFDVLRFICLIYLESRCKTDFLGTFPSA